MTTQTMIRSPWSWLLLAVAALAVAAAPRASRAGPCDAYAAGGTPCVAAHSTVRALYGAYTGSLYQVRRSSDSTTRDIGVLSPGGYANAAAQDAFCAGTTCLITIIYDQSGRGNHLTQAPAGGAAGGPDNLANATAAQITINGNKAYGVFVAPGTGYRNNRTSGVATGDAPEGIYAIFDGTHYNGGCCFDYGNAETNSRDNGNGTMEAIYFGNIKVWGYGTGSGPWVMADLENGLFSGVNAGYNANDPSVSYRYLTAIVKGTSNLWAIRAGNAQSGGLSTFYSGKRPNVSGYNPMKKEGAIILGIGGDNSKGSAGTFYEGAMTTGYPSDATENAVQADIVAARYGATSSGSYALTVLKSGTGSGTVASTPSGIDCGSTCSATYASGTAVTLSAAAAASSSFAGWTGACTGTGTCIVTMTQAQSVTAAFDAGPVSGPVSINAGGSATGSFVADANYAGGSTYSTTSAIDTSAVASPVPPQAVFQTERYGEFTYTIPGLTAGAPYGVTLYFVESYWTAAGQRTFNVAINGTTVLSGFDIYAAAGGANKALAKTFSVAANASGQVVIAFTKGGGPDYPKVDGIAVAAGTQTGDTFALTVGKGGTGAGTVTGGGIDCGANCSATLASGAVVTLTATAASGSSFAGWSGACGGTAATCTLTMSAAQSVTATFTGPTTTCKAVSGGQSGNFNTTGAICFTVTGAVNGWGCSNADGRSVTVNGTATTCGKLPLPGSSPYTFSFGAGTYPWASFYWW